MKAFILLTAFTLSLNFSFAQEKQEEEKPEKKRGFKKENLFTGGGVNLGFGSGATTLGISPYFGYSLNRFVDVAASIGYNYTSQRDYVEYGDKARQSVFSPGVFTRIFPVKFLFAHAQYEHNFIRFKYLPASNGSYQPFTEKYNVGSLLVGPGYANGRGDGKSFYYISVLWDLLKDEKSPYVDGLGRPTPIIRAGFNIALFQGENF